MFPKIFRKLENNLESISVQFLKNRRELILDRIKCAGCGLCSRTCPKEAIQKGPIGASIRFPTVEDIMPNLYDPNKCVFCGVCVYLCPFSALTLKFDGKTVELSEIPIIKSKVVPWLDFKTIKLENNRIIKQYLEGEIHINYEKCPGGCSTCVDVCPSRALTIPPKPEKGWEISEKVQFDKDKCLYCGVCENTCPINAIELKILDVKNSGDFNEPFWQDLLNKIKKIEK